MKIILNNELLLIGNNINSEKLSEYLISDLKTLAIRNENSGSKYQLLTKNVNTNLYNTGFVGLASKCYSEHLQLAINPHDFWVIILSEISKEVVSSPEVYRNLFTSADKKQEISVMSSSLFEMPINILSKALSENVLFDSTVLFPNFSTETNIITETFQAIFCDMASPYYSYSMYMCGIPSIQLLGIKSDWQKIVDNLTQIVDLFKSPTLDKYLTKLKPILVECIDAFDNEPKLDFWLNFFTQKNQGSGGELFIDGWIKDLFIKEHQLPKIVNFQNNVGIVKYKQLDTNQDFAVIYGGFNSIINNDGFYQLDYQKYILQKESV